DTWRETLARHHYPLALANLLGELMAAAALLAASIKNEGRLIMEIRGDGAVHLATGECSRNGTMRGLVRWREPLVEGSLADMVGNGQLLVTTEGREPEQRYQGVVSLEAGSIGGALEHYFERSEQLATRLWLAADRDRAAGLLLQRLPGGVDSDDDAWNRVVHLAATLTAPELLSTDPQTLLLRLFHQERVRVQQAAPLRFGCQCSAQRVGNMLRGLGEAEVMDILDSEGRIEVTCEYCNQRYEYGEPEARALFGDETPPTLH
ncbi:MAG: Hsp33 family molecular chaperone HslO, partial [Pseudomonadota bacterium]|nr:Hsp33 family molecular chaperone HslO [Pseudomonadota bacterium]